MSGRTTRASQPTEDEIKELILKLQALLPQLNHRPNTKASASTILEETCSYIKRLHKEVGDLSQRLSQLLHDSAEFVEVDEELITRLLSNIN
ncbi:putative transcription factor bHLH family [Rosa chinensis]|uniref:Putative transcription factor bHLH family n=1 Tax=Rosa chinensis TaxID=74649 RepID=A0A2P6P2H5_ROSCH|nr:transcription factor ILI4 [Rosa chinensis]PRQ16137.1 putative transcription factor bHLH family [Rosa chinensis]